MIDFNTLTLGEAAFIEGYAGVPMAKFGDPDTPKIKMTIALATVLQRRDGKPTYSVKDAEKLTLGEVNDIIGVDEDADPDEIGEGSAAGE